MDPVIDNDWLNCKNDSIEESPAVGNLARSWQWRELGIDPLNYPTNKSVLENAAEDILVQKPLNIKCCELPGYPRSTFLMVFSPDGTKVASTHGNHNVYVSELASGKHVRILQGHPRTPWCITFHPSHPQLIGSGCLGGQVRVWDINSGGSEIWNVRNQTVIASIAFHPRVQILVIATYNELYFWDWSQSAPLAKVSTNNINEKVRYVAFDGLGHKLITGISSWGSWASHSPLIQHTSSISHPYQMNARRDEPDDSPVTNPNDVAPGSSQDVIVNSYHSLVQRYDSLVRNYQRLFMVRHRLSSTPPPPATTDRGTDPMETDVTPENNSYTRVARPQTSHAQNSEVENPTPSTSRAQVPNDDDSGEGSSSRFLNLDALTFDNNSSMNSNSPRRHHATFGSRPSAFQPLSEIPRPFRTVNQGERASRLLPNPFSSTSGTAQPSRLSFGNPVILRGDNVSNASRTSIFPGYGPQTIDLSPRRRRHLPSRFQMSMGNLPGDRFSSLPNRIPLTEDSSRPAPSPSSDTTSTNPANEPSRYSTLDLLTAPVDSQTITESLNLIRDILRDSGTRLVDLITRVSLSTLVGVGREHSSRNNSDDSEGGDNTRSSPRPQRLNSIYISSDSDSDFELNILRTPNATYREEESSAETTNIPSASEPAPSSNGERTANVNSNTSTDTTVPPSDRILIDLNSDTSNAGTTRIAGGSNVSFDSRRFHNRAQSAGVIPNGNDSNTSPRDGRRTSDTQTFSSDFNPNRPSTSRDMQGSRNRNTGSGVAFRKVRAGVSALQKHTVQLTNLWLHGTTISLRDLRTMWENLRRRIYMMHRDHTRQETPSYFTRSLLERCRTLNEMTEVASRTSGRSPSRRLRSEEFSRTRGATQNMSPDMPSTSTSNGNTSTNHDDRRTQPNRSPQLRRSSSVRSSPSLRRRLQSSFRWRAEDELRRRSRVSAPNRLSQRHSNRARRDYIRAIEIAATRHEIRMRAMQVLSVMFNTMMTCLEERGLSQVIINMLRLLKKALALTCLMLMTSRASGRVNTNSLETDDSLNVIRIQNVDHSGPVNVDGPDESPNNSIMTETEVDRSTQNNQPSSSAQPSTSAQANSTNEDSPISNTQRWSNRLAVQIAAANRNNSLTARNRRELYMESKRQKALHKSNPTAHPLIKKRVLPPVVTHRIPTLRLLPRRSTRNVTLRSQTLIVEPNAAPASGANPRRASSRVPPDVMDEFEQRINLIRIAHLQAVRLRNAARNRFRRLHSIRFYTPSSVRDMFSLQPNNPEDQQENRPQSRIDTEETSPRFPPTNTFDFRYTRNQIFPDTLPGDPAHFHTVFNNVAMPLMQVNDLPTNEVEGPQPQRPPRIHEYLQPIILAQNAMVVDEDGNGEGIEGGSGGGGSGGGGGGGGGGGEGGGGGGLGLGARRPGNGMAGLLDAGIISEAFPAPSHRVQAWDFTNGETPDISDSTKNVVVQRCKIHNDASIDISKDGKILVALLPLPRLRNSNHWLGVYSLEWARLGQCLHTAALEQSAVSVALSPTARHLAVGLGSRRFSSTHAAHNARANVFAYIYRLEPKDNSSRTGLSPIKELEQNWEHGFRSLNCLRWAPQPGQGFVYANNTGQLVIMS